MLRRRDQKLYFPDDCRTKARAAASTRGRCAFAHSACYSLRLCALLRKTVMPPCHRWENRPRNARSGNLVGRHCFLSDVAWVGTGPGNPTPAILNTGPPSFVGFLGCEGQGHWELRKYAASLSPDFPALASQNRYYCILPDVGPRTLRHGPTRPFLSMPILKSPCVQEGNSQFPCKPLSRPLA